MSKPYKIKNPYTASTWFITINTNQVTELASFNTERMYVEMGFPTRYLVKYNAEKRRREGPATSDDIAYIEVSRVREVGKRGQFHMHVLWRVLVNRPHKIQLDSKKLHEEMNRLNGGSKVWVKWKLVEDKALALRGYMRKDLVNGEMTETTIDDFHPTE